VHGIYPSPPPSHGRTSFDEQQFYQDSHVSKRYRSYDDESSLESTASLLDIKTNPKYSTVVLKCLVAQCSDYFFSTDELYDHLSSEHRLRSMLCPVYRCNYSCSTM